MWGIVKHNINLTKIIRIPLLKNYKIMNTKVNLVKGLQIVLILKVSVKNQYIQNR